MYKGAVFFDYDGTLIDGAAGIMETTARTRQAIAQLRERGYLAVLDTGRAMCYASSSGVEFDGMITSNGSYALVCGEEVLNAPIGAEVLGRLTTRLNEMGIYYGIDHPVKCYARDQKEASFVHWLDTFGISPDIFRPIPKDEQPVGYKLSVLYHTMEEVEALRAEFGRDFAFDCHRGYPCVDVTPAGANKGTGVRAVIEHFGLDPAETYAFGDGENDLDMLKNVRHAVAMGKYAPPLKEACEFITKTVKDDGIAFGLAHYGLI